jgi:hypothetical protein
MALELDDFSKTRVSWQLVGRLTPGTQNGGQESSCILLGVSFILGESGSSLNFVIHVGSSIADRIRK